jgi:hypothetical protein
MSTLDYSKRHTHWVQCLGLLAIIVGSNVAYADEFVQDFPKLSVRGSLGGTKCVDATRSINLPSGYEIDYTQGNTQGYLITVVSEKGRITRTHTLDPATKTLTSTVKVCANTPFPQQGMKVAMCYTAKKHRLEKESPGKRHDLMTQSME